MIKKIRYMIVSVMLLLILSACGKDETPSTAASQPEDPLAAAEQEFRQAFSGLSGVHSDLSQKISAAEALLEAVAEEDVADTAVLSDLRTALEEAKSIPSLTRLEMGDTLEEIRQQQQSLSEQNG